MRKADLKGFTPTTKAVCAIVDGSSNSYLIHDRAVEDFLKVIEPQYAVAIQRLHSGEIDHESVEAIAGYLACVLTCTPAAIRINSELYKAVLEQTARAMDDAGRFPIPPPPSLGGSSLSELLDRNKITIVVDPKYPQAMGITSLLDHTARQGNGHWEILHNDFDDSPFFTSDFPLAIEQTSDPRMINRVFPLSPRLAVRVIPRLALNKSDYTLEFRHFSSRVRRLDRKEVRTINRRLVQCAEETVFFRDDRPWIAALVAKNRNYRLSTRTEKMRMKDGAILCSRQVITCTDA